MEFKEIVDLVVSNGVAIGVIIYFMFRDWKIMGRLQETLNVLVNTVNTLKEITVMGGRNNEKDG